MKRPDHTDGQVCFGYQREKGKCDAYCLRLIHMLCSLEMGLPWGPPSGRLRVTLYTVFWLLDTQLGGESEGYVQLPK